MHNLYRSGMYGLIVGDALGVPVEFKTREELRRKPVTKMLAHGTHDQPAGTWSDDSSMALATLDSIRTMGKLDYDDIMNRFVDWCEDGAYTPFDDTFDIGGATHDAIMRYLDGMKATEAGGRTEYDNGNGSLMRILPVCLYLIERQKMICTSADESIYHIHAASSLTHAHPRSLMACGIFFYLAKAIAEGTERLEVRLQRGMDEACAYYRRDLMNFPQMERYKRLTDVNAFGKLPEDAIASTGYVVDTLEAAVWCLLNTSNYRDAVLLAVNLGYDTDTVGAVTGALAGLYYGEENIPREWLDEIKRKELIEEILEK